MIQAIIIDIITDDQPAIDAISAQVPDPEDVRIWETEYSAASVGNKEDGKQHLTASLRCHTAVGQSEIADAIIQAVLDNAMMVDAGSSVKLHTCFHDEQPPKSCTETILYEVA